MKPTCTSTLPETKDAPYQSSLYEELRKLAPFSIVSGDVRNTAIAAHYNLIVLRWKYRCKCVCADSDAVDAIVDKALEIARLYAARSTMSIMTYFEIMIEAAYRELAIGKSTDHVFQGLEGKRLPDEC